MIRRSVCIAFLSLLLVSCSWYSSGDTHALQNHREMWENLDVANYQFTFDSKCFCDQGPLPAQIVVRAETLHAVLDPETKDTLRARGSNRPVWKERPRQYPTVDRLFEIVDGELSKLYNRPDSIHVEYNDRYGFPEHIYIDEQANTFDDELTITAQNLKVDLVEQQ